MLVVSPNSALTVSPPLPSTLIHLRPCISFHHPIECIGLPLLKHCDATDSMSFSKKSLWDCDKVSPGLATWPLDKTGRCASYAMKATTSPAAWGLPKDRWATTGTSVWRNQPVLSMHLVITVCNYAFSELTMSWNLPVTGISALESNDFDCWALSAECSKNAWIQGLPFLRKTWPGNHILSTSVVFLGDLKTFWL